MGFIPLFVLYGDGAQVHIPLPYGGTYMDRKTKSLFSYIFPALGGLFVTYLYNVADGIFVGRGVGAAALGAVNIAVPFITFVVAVSATFPMGGATIAAIRMGRGDKDGACQAFTVSLFMTIILSLVLMAVGMIFSDEIVSLSGADKLSTEMRNMSAEYLFYYSAFSVPMLISSCLSVFVRNDGSPALSFAGMCAGAAANIFLDWLFIFPLNMGVDGAAIASGLGQIFSVIVLMTHFLRKKGCLRIKAFKLDLSIMKKVCQRGVPEAVTQLTTPVTAFCYNIMLAKFMGDIGVSTFSVLSFIYSLVNAVLCGVSQGLQPLWGYCYGRRDSVEMNWYFRWGIIINTISSVVIYALLVLFDEPVINIFNSDAALVDAAVKALPVFSISFIPMAVNLIYTAYFFSTKRTGEADVIAVSRGIILKALAVFCIPMIFGGSSIWMAPFLAETVTFFIAIGLNKTNKLVYK